MSYAKLEFKVPDGWRIDEDGRNAYFFGTVIKISEIQSMEISESIPCRIIYFISTVIFFLALFILFFLVKKGHRMDFLPVVIGPFLIGLFIDYFFSSIIIYLSCGKKYKFNHFGFEASESVGNFKREIEKRM